jgi:hypothetical protein
MAERPSGSDRGRPSIDWEEAFRAYASMPDSERSYHAVAKLYDVSVRTVETHGRKERWKERLAGIKAEAAASADEQLVDAYVQQLAELDLLIDASLTSYAHQLRAGSVKVVPADLPRLFKLRADVSAEIASPQRVRPAEVEDDLIAEDAEARKRELVAALAEAGAFERLRNSISLPHAEPGDGAATEEAA